MTTAGAQGVFLGDAGASSALGARAARAIGHDDEDAHCLVDLRSRMGGFWLYWLIAAFSMKRGRVPWSRELRIRAVLIVVVIVLVRLGAFRHDNLASGVWRAVGGLLLFAVGLGFAIWARVHIGRNWGSPMSEKTNPELVTSGPYALVRHPIYSGILVAGVGTSVGVSWHWLTAVVLAAAYFVYSATVEERYLAQRFPASYPAYKQSTKMFVPFVI